MKTSSTILPFILFCLLGQPGWSQTANICTSNGGGAYCTPPQTGVPPFGTVGGGPFDAINQGTLNVNFLIPVFARPGRGLNFSYALAYDSWIWYPIFSSTTQSMQWQHAPNWGWDTTTQLSGYYTSQQTQPGTCSANTLAIMYTQWTYHDTLGTAHVFPWTLWSDSRCGLTSASGLAPDDSGYTMTVSTAPSVSASVVSRSGTTIILTANSSTLQDSNGNQNTFNGSAFFDTQSSTAPVLTITGSQNTSLTYSYTNPQGGSSSVVVHYSQYTVQTNASCGGYIQSSTPNVSLPSSITMPDQTQYGFTYQQTPGSNSSSIVTGRIQSVTLPTGGIYTYNYPTQYLLNGTTPVNGGDTWCTDGTSTALQRITPDQGTWNYTRVYPGPEMDIQAPDSTVAKIAFPGNGPSANYVYQETVWPSGASNPIAASRTFYNGCVWWTSFCSFVLPITQTGVTNESNVTMSGGSISASLMAETDTVFTLSGLPLSAKEYDFGANAKGSLLRETDIDTYATWDRPHMITTKDGGGAIKKQTTFTYDEFSLTPSGAPQLGTVTAPRGNPTTVSYLVQGSSTLGQTIHYYDTGLAYTILDVNGSLTTNTYGQCGNSFLTNIAMPLSLSRSMTWYCDGGVVASSTDMNLKTTNFSYVNPNTGIADPFWRLSQITYPDGGQATTTYNDTSSPPNVTTSQLIATGSSLTTQTNFDGLGRPIRKMLTSDPSGTDYADTTYDSFGRVYSVSNPYRTTSDPTYGVTYYAYDALSRPKMITRPDSNTVLMTYAGRAAEVQDEGNGTSRVAKVYQGDALGRLVSVCEVTGTAQLGITPTPAACGQDIAATGFLTSYQYNPLGNVLSVSQGGLTQRLYAYDGLSRLTSSTNPESGQTTYTYDTATKGDLYQRVQPKTNYGPGSGNVTGTYVFDALHRLNEVSYDDGITPYTFLTYDISNPWGKAGINTKGQLVATGSYNASTGALMAGEGFITRDAMGRVTWKLQNNSSQVFNLNYTYDYLGDVSTLSSGQSNITYNYNNADQLTSVLNSIPWVLSAVTYNALGQPTSDTLGSNGNMFETYAYTNRGWLNSYTVCVVASNCTNPSVLYTFNIEVFNNGVYQGLGFAPNGNILASNDWINGNWTYSYDAFNRLSSSLCGANCPGNQSTVGFTYSYDRFGNRMKQTVTAGTGNSPNYLFDANNHVSGSGMSYDGAGNLLNDGFHTYAYDAQNRLVVVDGGAEYYTYNAEGQRVSKTNGSGTVTYLYDLAGHQIGEISSAGVWNREDVYAGGRHLITNRPAGGVNAIFDFSDWLGTERARAARSTAVQQVCTNMPFGDSQSCTNMASDLTPEHFTGLQFDSSDLLTNAGNRRLSTTQGRWTSSDPAGLAAVNPANPQSLNRYAYGMNNPTGMVDPTGLDGCDWGDPITCIVSFGGVGSGGGISFSGGSIGFGPIGGGGGNDGFCLAYCSGRNIVTAIIQQPGGAAQVRIPGPAYRVMSDDSFPVGSLAYNTFGPPSAALWHAANGTMEDLTIAYAAGFATAAAAPSAVGLAARGLGWYYAYAGVGSGGVVLGRNPEYLDAAEEMGAQALNAGKGTYEFFMNAGEWTTLNQSYLNAQIFRAQQFFLSNPPLGQAGSDFAMELEYLTGRGIGPQQWQYVPLQHLWY